MNDILLALLLLPFGIAFFYALNALVDFLAGKHDGPY